MSYSLANNMTIFVANTVSKSFKFTILLAKILDMFAAKF